MYRKTLLTTPIVLGLLTTACSTAPTRVEMLDEARITIDDVEAHPLSGHVATDELDQAREYLTLAEHHLDEGDELAAVEHDAYLALRHAEVARNRIQESVVRDDIERSEAERNKILLSAREQDVDRALELAESRAREARLQEREARQAQVEADRANAKAAAALAENRALRSELSAMENELTDLEAEATARGLVLTLGDVLFDTDRSTLKPGAGKTMDRLAGFLEDHPDRRLLIEGHTDAQGDSGYNQALSERRADAVRQSLIRRGVAAQRLESVGLGESYPVATNDTVAGRQENRRVEIVVSDKDGSFPASAQREIAQR